MVCGMSPFVDLLINLVYHTYVVFVKRFRIS